MLERLNGMFAIVIVDLRTREIHIARDHFGIKPFYWAMPGDTLLFASEAKSFLRASGVSRRARCRRTSTSTSPSASSPARTPCSRACEQLRPGHCLRITPTASRRGATGEIPDQPTRRELVRAEALEQLRAPAPRQRRESQLLSDVKVGCQLSGGIDSSLVSVFARSHFDADMDTFSVVFDDPGYSEEHWMAQAAMRPAPTVTASCSRRDFFLTPSSRQPGTWTSR